VLGAVVVGVVVDVVVEVRAPESVVFLSAFGFKSTSAAYQSAVPATATIAKAPASLTKRLLGTFLPPSSGDDISATAEKWKYVA
jgi:hypothetical protein